MKVSRKHFGQRIGAGAGYEWFRWMKCNVVNRLVELLTMRRDLLHTSLAVQIPQTNRTIMTCNTIHSVGCEYEK